ncbi:ABC transporter ATP-binding protein [Pontimicrobium aquaticum]|uniref:ABC transporter ATP-binding protein n=1 Tax=Pontimicrobium aquaticum TaxID=2565367 RepID=A0A4U0ESX9_9FLAO|nr:ABC transporter ATP-binding protein [Pontimicrobium aquaticum]TJY34850.1 ABC transporter ATP-binding protein [Pontimicrobium aquaticum]
MLQVKNIFFSYQKTKVLKNISFSISSGENLSIIGESGSGKSTLLKLIYGEYDLDEGSIQWKNNSILGPSHNLVIGYPFMKYVAQEFDLMPYITVEENIGKYLSNFYPEEKQKRIKELIEVVELTEFAKTKVQYLSGGQKQRVALARAIALQPEIILLDEPFSHIDNFKKQSLRRNLFNYLKAHSITCIVATHDKNDVLSFSDKMIVLSKGKIIACEKPKTLYNNPKSPIIASFFGEFNVIEPYGILYAHQIQLVECSNLKATVKKSYYYGNYYLVEAILNNETVFFETSSSLKNNQEVCLKISKN